MSNNEFVEVMSYLLNPGDHDGDYHLLERCTCDDACNSYIGESRYEKLNPDFIEPAVISQSGLVTVVRWEDGTVTSVRLNPENAAQNDIYAAFLAALGKKLFGTTARVHELVDTHTKEYLNAQKEKEKQARRDANAAAEKKAYERKLKAEIKKQMLTLDAQIQILNGAKELAGNKED